jgi:ribulose-5-phosphate 4-epimerase/fuculose-1-phosphate aldolase
VSADLRRQIVDTGRAMLQAGLVAGTSGNVSGREGELVHITPSAMPYDEIEPDDLVTLSLDGQVVAGERPPSSERLVHLALYAARPQAAAIVHTHSVHATAWSFLGEPLDVDTEELIAAAGGPVRCASHGESGSDELAHAVLTAFKDRSAALMARHGVVAFAATPAEALAICTVIERQAQVAWLLRGA